MEDKDKTKNQLIDELGATRKRIAEVETLQTGNDHLKETIRKLEHDLRERTKELNCLYGIANVVEKPNSTLEEILQGIANLLPHAWQHSEVACSRITRGTQEFRTDNFKETPLKQSSDITVQGSHIGTVEVFYLEERRKCEEEPFLKEEQRLIDAIAERLGKIIERKTTEGAIRESEEQYRSIFKNAVEGIFQTTPEGSFLSVNPAMASMFGFVSPEEMITKITNVSEQLYINSGDRERYLEILEKQGTVSGLEMQAYRKNGRIIWISMNARAVKDINGKTLYFEGTLVDITERKQVEEALQESQQRLSDIINFLPDATFAIDKEGKVIVWNRAIEEMSGVKANDMLGKGDHAHALPFYAARRPILIDLIFESVEEIKNKYHSVQKEGDILIAEADVPVKGEVRALWGKASPLYDSKGNIAGAIESIRDITDRKQAEDALRKSEQTLHVERDKLQTISENAPFGITLIDKNGAFTYLNPTFRKMFGYDLAEIQNGRTWFRKVCPDKAYRHSVISAWIEDFSNLNPGERKNKIFTVICKDGTQKTINFIPTRLLSGDYLVTYEDVTELKYLEVQLRQSQKMEAIGTLAGGVAHDFNNILTTIIGYGSILQMGMDDEDPRKQYLDQILTSSQKAANLTQSLLAFSRKQVIELKTHSLNTILMGMEKLLKRLLTEDIEFKVVPADPDVSIMADMTQIDQVLMNLAANARDAMPKGGRLVIEAEKIILGNDFVEVHGFDKPGSYALISVTDTGSGMDEATREKIFDPFFTTKEVGRGTGLGLAIVYGIIKQHNGHINVYSEPGRGTVFRIYLPAVKAQPEELRRVNMDIQGGNEIILVAEDNKALRKLTKEVLARKGYTVIEAIDGDDAIDKFMEQKDTIDLLILDVVMPKKNGKEVYEEVKKVKPDMKTLFTSGYTGDVVRIKEIQDETVDFISKPLAPNDLLLKVREVLDK